MDQHFNPNWDSNDYWRIDPNPTSSLGAHTTISPAENAIFCWSSHSLYKWSEEAPKSNRPCLVNTDAVRKKCLTFTLSTLFHGVTALFTCGGAGDSGYLSLAEVTDLSSLDRSPPLKTCKAVPDMPRAERSVFALWDESDNSVLCCGGVTAPSTSKQCFKYTGAEWIDLGEVLRHERKTATKVKLSDGRYWISGGGFRYEPLNLCAACGVLFWVWWEPVFNIVLSHRPSWRK